MKSTATLLHALLRGDIPVIFLGLNKMIESPMSASPSEAEAKLQDSLASSISTYLLALATLAVAYAFIAASEYERSRAISHLPGLDFLLAARQVAAPDKSSQNLPTKRELPDFFKSATRAEAGSTSDGRDPYDSDILDSRGFTIDTIPRTRVSYFSSRLFQRRCKAVSIQLAAGQVIDYATFQIVGKTYITSSENILLISFDGCFSGVSENMAFFVFRTASDLVFGFPNTVEGAFPALAPPHPFKSFEYRDVARLIELLPAEIKPLVKLEHPIILLHASAIEHYILRHATSRHGRYYSTSELDLAVDNLFHEQVRTATLVGISASLSNLMLLGPLLYFVISFELWRRVRRLQIAKNAVSVYWFGSDTRDIIGVWAARCYSFLPLAGAAMLYGSFTYVNGLNFVSMEQITGMLRLHSIGIPPATVLRYFPIDFGAVTLLLVFPVQLFISISTFRRLHRLSLENKRQIQTVAMQRRREQARRSANRPVRR